MKSIKLGKKVSLNVALRSFLHYNCTMFYMRQRKNRDYSDAERFQAFVLYLEKESIEPVEQRYPEHVAFVEQNKHKTYQEVKDACLGLVYQS